jgi:hypothetical protein
MMEMHVGIHCVDETKEGRREEWCAGFTEVG